MKYLTFQVTSHPFQLYTKSDKPGSELMLVAVTAGLCDVISTLVITKVSGILMLKGTLEQRL